MTGRVGMAGRNWGVLAILPVAALLVRSGPELAGQQRPCRGGLPFIRGDCDVSGVVDIGDPIFNLTVQFVGGEYFCCDACDVDDSGRIDISDPIYNLTFQFAGRVQPPAPPFARCGGDPTPDELGCEIHPCGG